MLLNEKFLQFALFVNFVFVKICEILNLTRNGRIQTWLAGAACIRILLSEGFFSSKF